MDVAQIVAMFEQTPAKHPDRHRDGPTIVGFPLFPNSGDHQAQEILYRSFLSAPFKVKDMYVFKQVSNFAISITEAYDVRAVSVTPAKQRSTNLVRSESKRSHLAPTEPPSHYEQSNKYRRIKPERNVIRKDRKSTRLNSSHSGESRMPSSA